MSAASSEARRGVIAFLLGAALGLLAGLLARRPGQPVGEGSQ